MTNLLLSIENYLKYCKMQKRLDSKTLKAYRIDLTQFYNSISFSSVTEITTDILETYIGTLHQNFKPKTSKRKIASLKAFFRYLEFKDILPANPFYKIRTKFREPLILPKTIPLTTIENLLSTVYAEVLLATTPYQKKSIIRDIAVLELLFATGIRVSELCALCFSDINLHDNYILIHGKGSKERRIFLCSDEVITALINYMNEFCDEIEKNDFFFINRIGKQLSEQSVRNVINKYANLADISMHITPHMFRHSFATSLLEADVDIRYIQEMLGHSSINITEIYTHVALSKQKNILTTKHPRRKMTIS